MTTVSEITKPITLCFRKGKKGVSVCWLSALACYAGHGHTDDLPCVSPSIRRLSIIANDAFRDSPKAQAHRDRVLLPRLFDILDTVDPENEVKRIYILVDAAVRIWAPHALRLTENADLIMRAEILESLPEIVDAKTARKAKALTAPFEAAVAAEARTVVYADNTRNWRVFQDVAKVVNNASYASAEASNWYTSNAASWFATKAAARVAGEAADAAADAANDDDDARADFIENSILPVLDRMIEAGRHLPKGTIPIPAVSFERWYAMCGVENKL